MRASCQQQHRHRIAEDSILTQTPYCKSSILTQELYCEMLYIDTDIML